MAIKRYTPEMGQEKPQAQIEMSLCHYGKHYYLATPLELKGRGIKHLKTYQSKDLHEKAQHKIGWHEYRATVNAVDKLKDKYDISVEALLD